MANWSPGAAHTPRCSAPGKHTRTVPSRRDRSPRLARPLPRRARPSGRPHRGGTSQRDDIHADESSEVVAGTAGHTDVSCDERPSAANILPLPVIQVLLRYEWAHHLIHSPYRPRSAWLRNMSRNHIRHHVKSQHYWFGVTVTSATRCWAPSPTKAPARWQRDNRRRQRVPPRCRSCRARAARSRAARLVVSRAPHMSPPRGRRHTSDTRSGGRWRVSRIRMATSAPLVAVMAATTTMAKLMSTASARIPERTAPTAKPRSRQSR